MKLMVKQLLVVAFVFGFTISSQARAGRHKGDFHEKILKQLNLTTEQAAQLKAIKQSEKADIKKMREDKKALHDKMKQALASDSSEEALRKIHNQKMDLRKQIADARFEKMLSVRKILTSEQRKKFHELMEKKRGRRGRGHHAPGDREED